MRTERVFVILLALLAGYQFVWAVAATGTVVFDSDSGAAPWVIALVNAAGVALIVTGFRHRSRAPLRAGILLAAGVVPSILMFWAYIPPIIALAVAIYAVLNGRSHQRQLGDDT